MKRNAKRYKKCLSKQNGFVSFELKLFRHTCTATAHSIDSRVRLLLIKQNLYFFLLYFYVHPTKLNLLLLLAHYIASSLQGSGDLSVLTKQPG